MIFTIHFGGFSPLFLETSSCSPPKNSSNFSKSTSPQLPQLRLTTRNAILGIASLHLPLGTPSYGNVNLERWEKYMGWVITPVIGVRSPVPTKKKHTNFKSLELLVHQQLVHFLYRSYHAKAIGEGSLSLRIQVTSWLKEVRIAIDCPLGMWFCCELKKTWIFKRTQISAPSSLYLLLAVFVRKFVKRTLFSKTHTFHIPIVLEITITRTWTNIWHMMFHWYTCHLATGRSLYFFKHMMQTRNVTLDSFSWRIPAEWKPAMDSFYKELQDHVPLAVCNFFLQYHSSILSNKHGIYMCARVWQ